MTIGAVVLGLGGSPALGQEAEVRTGAAAFGSWREDAPGVVRKITPDDLPAPFATRSASNRSDVVRRPSNAAPQVPAGFSVSLFASGLERPRLTRVAPNGDVFVAETAAGRIRVLRAGEGAAEAQSNRVFASGLNRPFGIAFYPPGPDPRWVYVANTDSVVRFPYRSGDDEARGRAETVVRGLPTGGHSTRDVVFSKDGGRMFVSVGSRSNVGEDLGRRPAGAERPLGAPWGPEERRALVLAFDPEGGGEAIFATGIRNCVGMAVHPGTGDLWCSVNERDGLGDNLVPDYVTRVREGAFYGWPWYYIGGNEDPRHKGARPDLAGTVTPPDVLIQAHSASMQMVFYEGAQFPARYRGGVFAAQHGSWNRSGRTGYKLIFIPVEKGVPDGSYEDFATGFVIGDEAVWGRPVGVAVLPDGSLLLTEDGSGTMWRIRHEAAGPTP